MSKIIITGSTRGIGFALANKFLELGDSVLISSRHSIDIEYVVDELSKKYPSKVYGKECDVGEYGQLIALGEYAKECFGVIDFWINNAGITNSKRTSLLDTQTDDIINVNHINLNGTIFGVKAALNSMATQSSGHILIMGGMGTSGRATPNSLAYGVSKAGFHQLLKTLVEETKKSPLGIHMILPGMVLSDLLLKDATLESKRIFNILAEKPSTVANYIVPKVKNLNGTGKYIKFLKPASVIFRFATAWRYKNRFFDENGKLIEE